MTPKPPGGLRRRSRGRRGGRGRRRPAAPVPAVEASVEKSAPVEQVVESPRPVASEPKREISAISRAIEEVTEIIESLKHVLDQMEEVLELTEVAERQKFADEHEITALRRALHQLERPRSGGQRIQSHRTSQRSEEQNELEA